ncbi:MAG TPA: class I SAM-dependent methyltransferase [Thermoanaerobaculia bacterium]|nr:class I SAM-dependent methyltransferase [Thermoanaerobaculia bacterium]
MADRFIDTPPAGADGWRKVWEEDLRYRPAKAPSRLREWIYEKIRARFDIIFAADLERDRNYNVALLDMLRDVRAEAEAVRRDLRADLEAAQADVRHADDVLARDLGRTGDEVRRIGALVPVASMRNDALIAALDQKIEAVAVRVRDVTNPRVTAPESAASQTSDVLYRRLEDGLRGSEAEVREAVRPYVELARTHQPLIDAGCGRGELLRMCREEGIAARGFDVNERSVADLVASGLDVQLLGLPQCLQAIAGGTAGTVVAMHVVEHLPVEVLFSLFYEAARALRAGGLLIIETPNAESLAVTGSEFWRDPTHLAPRHPAALTLLAREHGFAIEDVRPVHPFPDGNRLPAGPDDPPGLRRLVEALNERLFGGQDLRMILRKG